MNVTPCACAYSVSSGPGTRRLGRHDDEPPAGQQRQAQVPERDVEARRGELQHPARPGPPRAARSASRPGSATPAWVTHHALGPPGRAGRVDHVRGVVDVQAGTGAGLGGSLAGAVAASSRTQQRHAASGPSARSPAVTTHDRRGVVEDQLRCASAGWSGSSGRYAAPGPQHRHLRDDQRRPSAAAPAPRPLRAGAARGQHARPAGPPARPARRRSAARPPARRRPRPGARRTCSANRSGQVRVQGGPTVGAGPSWTGSATGGRLMARSGCAGAGRSSAPRCTRGRPPVRRPCATVQPAGTAANVGHSEYWPSSLTSA